MRPPAYPPHGIAELQGDCVLFHAGANENGDDGLLGSFVGRLHVPHCARSCCHAGTVNCDGAGSLFLFLPKFLASTIQLPAICLNGLGIFAPTVYGPKQIPIPIPIVSVGDT